MIARPTKITAIEGYARSATVLIPRYESISSADLYAPVGHLLPKRSGNIIDLGAGTGRDAAGIALHRSPRIEWFDDRLPTLSHALKRGRTFDLVLLSAVWQHLDGDQRQVAMPKLRTLTGPGGLLMMSIRNGPGSPTRPCFNACPRETIELASAAGFRLIFRTTAGSVQAANRAAGVTWDWLAFLPDAEHMST